MKIQPRYTPVSPARGATPARARNSSVDRAEIGGRRPVHGEGYKMFSGFCSGAICASVLSMVGGGFGHAGAGFAVGGLVGAVMGYISA